MACPAEEQLGDLVTGSLAETERTPLLEHIEECDTCRSIVAELAGAEPPSEEEIVRGTQLGRYQIVERIGGGGMGVVYAAYDPELDRKVALKLLRSQWSDAEARARLVREGKVMARMQHPNVITVLDIGVWRERDFIAMELIDGSTLSGRGKPRKEVLRALIDAGRGLEAAHAEGLVHRDFKPENVLVSKSGRVLVTDFGLAKVDARPDSLEKIDLESTRTGSLVGTPAYMAPEQLEGATADARSDQFSFCVTAFEALFGARPFAGKTLQGLLEEIRAGRISGGSGALKKILARGLEVDPEKRFPSMSALLAELEAFANRRPLRLVAAAVMILLVGVGALMWPARLCTGGDREWSGVWDAPRKEKLHAVFAATKLPYAEDAFRGVSAILDGYRDRWVAMHTQACEAARVRGVETEEQMGLRMECLSERLRDARAYTQLLENADGEVVQRAVVAAVRLPEIDRCSDLKALRSKVPPPPGDARVKQISEQRAQASALDHAGRFTDALAIARPLADRAKEVGYRPLEAEVLDALGDIEADVADYPAAQASLQNAILAAEAGGHSEAAIRAWVLLTGLEGMRQKKFSDAHASADHARALLERLGGDRALEASLDDNLGLTWMEEGKYAEAKPLFEKALTLRAPDDVESGVTLSSLGNLLRKEGDAAGAVQYHQRALQLFEKTLGPSHPRVAQALKSIGNSYWSKGQADDALPYYEKSLAILEKALGEDHPDVASVRVNVAAVQLQKGKFDEAIDEYRRVISIYEKRLGPDSAELLPSLNNVSVALQSKGQLAEAEKVMRRALGIAEKTYGPEHPEVETALVNLGDMLLSEKKFDASVACYQRACAISEKTVGPDHPHTGEDLGGLGFVLVAEGKMKEAQPILERAVKIGEKGQMDPVNLAKIRFGLARCKNDRKLALAARKILAESGARQAPDVKEIDDWLRR